MFKKTNLILIIATVCILFYSCQTSYYYYVYSVKPVQEKIICTDKAIIYEDEECKISYDFWSYSGNSGFAFENKTDKNIYIDLSECFYINNGYAYDYFQDRKYTSSVSSSHLVKASSLTMADMNRLFTFYSTSYYTSNTKSSSVETPEQKIMAIPPHTTKVIKGFAISSSPLSLCPMFPNSKQIKNGDNIKTFSSKEYSPILFGNIIAYSFDKECKSYIRITNDFYINKVSIFREKDMYEDAYYVYDINCPNEKRYITISEYREIKPTSDTIVKKEIEVKRDITAVNNFYITVDRYKQNIR